MNRQRLETAVAELIKLDKVVPSAERYEVKKLLGREWKIVAGNIDLVPMWEFTRTVKLDNGRVLESNAHRARFNNLYRRDGINPDFHSVFDNNDDRETSIAAAEYGIYGVITVSQVPEVDLNPQITSADIGRILLANSLLIDQRISQPRIDQPKLANDLLRRMSTQDYLLDIV